MDEFIKSMKVIDKGTDTEYVLDFTRDSVRFAQINGFEPQNVTKFPQLYVKRLWYYAFRANHRSLSEDQTSKLFDKLFPKGIPTKYLKRLLELYEQASLSVIQIDDEDDEKNELVAVEL